MQLCRLSPAEVFARLETAAAGLDDAEAARRAREYGPNRVARARTEPWPLRLLREFTHFFAIILWLAAALSAFAAWRDPGQGMDRVAVAIVLVILVSGVFSFWQEFRVERTLAALARLLPAEVKVRRSGRVLLLAADALVPGDVVLLEQGEKVPADCRLVEAFGVMVNTATLTGESAPVPRNAAPGADGDPLTATNLLLAGTDLTGGQATAVVYATGAHTEFGRIAHLAQSQAGTSSPLRRELAHFSRLLAAIAIAIGLAFFALGCFIGVPLWTDVIFAIGIIVAMVPEGLLPTLTLALVLATQRLAKRKVLIRFLPAVETLGATTVICTDKTGTLTQNRMHVRETFVPEGRAWRTGAPDPARAVRFLHCAALCHDLKATAEAPQPRRLGDPTEIALVEMAERALGGLPAEPRIEELPFDDARMRMTVVTAGPAGAMAWCKGAPESILPLCTAIGAAGEARVLEAEDRRAVLAAAERMAAEGLRVVALAHRPLDPACARETLERSLVFAGLAALEDPPRPEVPAAIARCRTAGIRVVMVTGDHPRTALAVARRIGLVLGPQPLVLSGEALRQLSDAELGLALDAPEVVFARVGPAQKMRIVEILKQKRHIVAVTGDGVNDAPALKSAHIGIAMGRSGTDVAREAADMVLLDDNFASIVAAVEEGRAVFDNIRKFLTYILAHNVPELVPYLAFALFQIPLPLTPLQILCVDMGGDSLTALGLGVERAEPEVMRRPPRSADERLFDWRLALRAYLFLGLIEAVAAMSAYFLVLARGGWHYGVALGARDPLYLRATTACLGAIVLMQTVNVYLCRSTTRSIFQTGLRGNALIAWGVLVELLVIGVVVHVPPASALFGTAPLTPLDWLTLLPFALALLVFEELRKGIVRRRKRARSASDDA